ncbi:hypothetical protein CONPUDRAFT_167769 [Coniophora puteana RWD-64-598 SS2]|uniref:Uncharacterized protein n=1 Tax=Coniophora puteana (strain RWD-64-598) TaxID=741705 RepID=A0A5M3MEG8_CONPW|nr:uncharacterized protein CONPUDRAFT_167769 [Coniophora puteana RWD-64-598 SS2]EIW77669.1 hypothetical protein CONPUDRAFT_167769 [Coniophora puteana RWD-64-598 SS2]
MQENEANPFAISVAPTAVTFKPASHPAEPFDPSNADNSKGDSSSPSESAAEALLRNTCPNPYKKCVELLQSSIPKEVSFSSASIIPQRNGLVRALLKAYNRHRALVLRPDDVWLAILTQFSFFVNAHAEELRSSFVSHEGKKELTVTAVGSRYSVDFGAWRGRWRASSRRITVYAIALIATTKAYFDFAFCLMCGIPRVTLDGTRDDWAAILERIGKLKEYGVETTAWSHLLKPVVERFVHAFDNPQESENVDFWGKVTAFCVFTAEGKWQGPRLQNLPSPPYDKSYAELSGEAFAAKHFVPHPEGDPFIGDLYLTLDGTVEVDVKLNDNGQVFRMLLVAGGVGSAVSSSGDKALSGSGERDTVRPVPVWWMFVKNEKSEEELAGPSSVE